MDAAARTAGLLLGAKVVKIGPQRVQLGAGVRYWADSPEGGAHDFGARFIATFLFPRPAPARPLEAPPARDA